MAPDARDPRFTAADLEVIRARGIALEEAARQLELLRRPPPPLAVERPCTVGDGITRLPEGERARFERLHEVAAREGRCLWFVPASGAASRMFRELAAALEGPPAPTSPEGEALRQFLHGLHRFPFYAELARALARAGGDLARFTERDDLARAIERGDYRPVLAALLEPAGLGYAERPKGLLPFHAAAGETRTAFDEQLVEAARVVAGARGVCRAHFTVSSEHAEEFRGRLEGARARLEARHGVRLEVAFSVQKPSTDTLALDTDGRPFRAADGTLLFRPGGHGALIENLEDLRADLVFVKNIDNVAIESRKSATFRWSRTLLGMLAGIQRTTFELLLRLEDERDAAAPEDAIAFARGVLLRAAPADTRGRSPAARRAAAIALLHRPLRVCGMVPNTGEPGGGPFWVRGPGGESSLQIVESAQLDLSQPEQRRIAGQATHFHPVFMACGLRDHHGEPLPLARFVDPQAAIVTRKSHGGRELLTFERPGLWNGAMAGWNSVFVEVPVEVFNPVKTVNDLLRPEHQGFDDAPP